MKSILFWSIPFILGGTLGLLFPPYDRGSPSTVSQVVEEAHATTSLKSPTPYVYPVKEVLSVHDGDTQEVLVDLGFDTYRKLTLRIDGVDTPEVTGVSKKAGFIVRNAVSEWLAGSKLTIESKYVDKYGRALAEVYNIKGCKLSEFLLSNKLAVPYHGEKKPTWTAAALDAIILNETTILKKASEASLP